MAIDAKTLIEEARQHEKIAEALRAAARAYGENGSGSTRGPKGKFPELQEMLKVGPMKSADIIAKMSVSRAALYQWKKKYGNIVENKKGIWSLRK